MPRVRPPRHPVTLQLDGATIVAEEGEPLVIALIAAGHLSLARSPKFHRPRGPACLRAACDGCLARVDDEPNVMTCRVPAAGGMRVETQNVIGSSNTDLLRAADWFFPDGMNHHELLAGVPGAQRVLQALARRVAGLGRLPKLGRPPRQAERRETDTLVVGSGPAGMAVALALAKRGRRVEVVDDDLSWGGSARALGIAAANPWQPLLAGFAEAIADTRVTVRTRTTAAGIYGTDVLIAGESGVEILTPRTLVLAPGAHDGVLAFEGNDVPGVMSARAACWMAFHGVVPGEKVVVVVSDGGGPFGAAYAQAVAGALMVRGVPLRARGSRRVKEVTVVTPRGEERFSCDALLVDAPRAPAYELCAQAGAVLTHQAHGYGVKAQGGRIREGAFAVGEVAGTPAVLEAMVREAETVAESAAP